MSIYHATDSEKVMKKFISSEGDISYSINSGNNGVKLNIIKNYKGSLPISCNININKNNNITGYSLYKNENPNTFYHYELGREFEEDINHKSKKDFESFIYKNVAEYFKKNPKKIIEKEDNSWRGLTKKERRKKFFEKIPYGLKELFIRIFNNKEARLLNTVDAALKERNGKETSPLVDAAALKAIAKGTQLLYEKSMSNPRINNLNKVYKNIINSK
jgi:L-rhamnose mutarotase